MNEQTERHFEQLYFKHAKMIEHFAQECLTLKDKFGTESKLYKSKLKSLQFMREFHDETIRYFEQIEKNIFWMEMRLNAEMAVNLSHDCDISIDQSLKVLYGSDNIFSECLKIDDLHNLKERVHAKMMNYFKFEQKDSTDKTNKIISEINEKRGTNHKLLGYV